ncbi:response regulator [Haloprofundus salilacus]|uniref:response regulator n=1 Tax=Haloprofundus salilacus TaxID=2876190 RepID=UPI001CCFD4C2|nr:response regulator [Haloprofundus salilacus]
MIDHRAGAPLEILLVEDNPGDIRLTQEAFKQGKINNTLHVVMDGEEALDFVYQRKQHESAPRPDIVLLDLNLPKLNGQEVLATMKEDSDLKTIPVVVLTSSEADEDILKSYELGTNSYLTKPVNPDEFLSLSATFDEYWCTLVRLPQKK